MSDSYETLKQYGKVGIVTHLTLSWSFLLGTYLFIQKTGKSDVLIKKLKLENKVPAKAGSFVIAGIVYKAVMPARIAASLMLIPLVVKFLGNESEQQVAPTDAKVN